MERYFPYSVWKVTIRIRYGKYISVLSMECNFPYSLPGMTDSFFFGESQLIEAGFHNGQPEEATTEVPPPAFVPPCISIDVSHLFATDQIFPTRDDLINWVHGIAIENGYVTLITKSDYGGNGSRKAYVMLGCEKHGKYVPYRDPDLVEGTRSQKTGCPFRLKGRPRKNGIDRDWRLKVMEGIHNHEPARSLLGHNFVGRLKPGEKEQVGKMTRSWVPPRKMLLTLKENNPSNLTTISQIYGVCKRLRKSLRGGLTEMQHLLKKLDGDKYVHFERHEPGSEVIRDVFWAHPNAIKLFNTFPYVVIMDCTYKTNKYAIPLLEIVGLTSTDKTYSIAFCYIVNEGTDDYVWALECMKSLLADQAMLPKVIVTDRDLALLSAAKQSLPNTTHLLCLWHINKCVLAKCKLYVGTDDFAELVMMKWAEVVDAATVEEFEVKWMQLFNMCKAKYSNFTSYCSTTWLVHKEKFAKAWTNHVMHFGTTTSNRAEGAHASLKKMLRDCKGDLATSWDASHSLTCNRHTEILASFERSIHRIDHIFMFPFYTNIRGFVSNKCLQLIDDEHIRMKSYGGCDCLLRETHGLPCGCELAGYERIPYESIHPFWKRLSWEHVPEPVADTTSNHICGMNHGDMQPEVEALTHYFSSLDTGGQSMVRRKLQAIYCPESSSLCTPAVKIRSKRTLKANEKIPPKNKAIGSLTRDLSGFEHVDREIREAKKVSQPPKKKKRVKKSDTSYFMGHFPAFFHPYIQTVQNVEDDGICGYRAVAALLGLPSGSKWFSYPSPLRVVGHTFH
ncbi:PKS-NRPS hybrid synthetase cheA-like [Lotus japonicus]|uniref:PKS-NRPS hybrid synthetase cheA-like n=1 Tax=Lotus japonicus TaxID=34305 RepID=UPI00258C43A5|nr:PKS-NRPS hybrid synthetase cheA-like [Lotus japonicus]